MNRIFLMGRLSKDPEIRDSRGDNPIAIARYSLAVDKRQKREDGIKADFFQVVAFDRLADFAAKYLRKGVKIVLTGHVQTGTYENKEGVRMPFFEVVAEQQEFAESRNAGQKENGEAKDGDSYPDEGGFLQVPDDLDDLPFD